MSTLSQQNLTPSKKNLLSTLLDHQVLKLGNFTLKNGRHSPYFLDFGMLNNGTLIKLGECFAETIKKQVRADDLKKELIIFGPAYKGIALAISTANALEKKLKKQVSWLFNRKEIKKHGEGGRWVGKIPDESTTIIMVDDVITDGKSKLDALEMIREDFNTSVQAIVVGFNRSETEEKSLAIDIPLYSLLSLSDLPDKIKADLYSDHTQLSNEKTDRHNLDKMPCPSSSDAQTSPNTLAAKPR